MNEPCRHGHTLTLCEECRGTIKELDVEESIRRGREYSEKEAGSLIKEAQIHMVLKDYKLALDCLERSIHYLKDICADTEVHN